MFWGGGNQGGGGQPNFFFPGFGGGAGMQGSPGPEGQFNPLEMLFANGFGAPGPAGPGAFSAGGPGGFQMDPTLIENLFGPGAAAGFMGGPAAAAADEQRNGAPPTAKSTLRSLPRVKVSANDLERNESHECSICLDSLVLGEQAIRIPCGHLYHEDCVYDWLKKSNECPVCRYELPTDDVAYEKGREERIRKIRLHHAELAGRSSAELRRLAIFLKIDVSGCLEKSELVACIMASNQVEMVESADDAKSSSGLFDYACGPASSSASGVASEDPQQSRMVGAEGVSSLPEAREKRCRTDVAETVDASPPTTAASVLPLASQSVGQLRKLAKQLNVSLDGCLEKAEIVERIEKAPGYQKS